jgi:hypothetical protein
MVVSIPLILIFFTVVRNSTLSYIRMPVYATIRKVAVSIADEITAFLNWSNPSSRTTALGSTQSLTEMSTRNFPAGKRVAGA